MFQATNQNNPGSSTTWCFHRHAGSLLKPRAGGFCTTPFTAYTAFCIAIAQRTLPGVPNFPGGRATFWAWNVYAIGSKDAVDQKSKRANIISSPSGANWVTAEDWLRDTWLLQFRILEEEVSNDFFGSWKSAKHLWNMFFHCLVANPAKHWRQR